jgi:hypothetical protein
LNDVLAEAQAHGNMGITKMNLCLIEEAINNFESQLECLEAKNKVHSFVKRLRSK